MPADAEALGRCQLECWREAYADLVDPARLAPFLADVEGFVARWRRAARRRAAGSGWRRTAGALVGFATVRPRVRRRPRAPGGDLRRGARTGAPGSASACSTRRLGDEPATLRVFRDNARARRFYARNGFVPDGTETEEPRLGGVEIGMVRPAPTA